MGMAGFFCRCEKKDRKHWVITQYLSNRSAFNGYRETPSSWSEVRCNKCWRRWRTRAKYLSELRMSDEASVRRHRFVEGGR